MSEAEYKKTIYTQNRRMTALQSSREMWRMASERYKKQVLEQKRELDRLQKKLLEAGQ